MPAGIGTVSRFVTAIDTVSALVESLKVCDALNDHGHWASASTANFKVPSQLQGRLRVRSRGRAPGALPTDAVQWMRRITARMVRAHADLPTGEHRRAIADAIAKWHQREAAHAQWLSAQHALHCGRTQPVRP